jgi:hypothetical protein
MKCPIVPMAILLAPVLACGNGSATASPPASMVCDQPCADAIALRALRLTMKDVYNLTLASKPVGPQDQTTPCLSKDGSARVYGQATSNANQGTTSVELTYVFNQCTFSDSGDPSSTFQMTLTGTVTENGTIAVQPSSTTALQFKASGMSFSGTVYHPPIVYSESTCDVVVGQSGNELSGTMCGRNAGVTL